MAKGNDPRSQLPAGRILTRETEDELMSLWASVDFRTLTDTEIEGVVGAPLPTPTIRREFPTGRYPIDYGKRF
ncbi:MAG: hypothetical protein V2I24_09385 [Halieaceae bacterium]|nr:hypothetical protein [Halieaceae bacterium]